MSAFIVSNAHIHALVTAALDLKTCGVTKHTADRTGQMLVDENVRSVLHRYLDLPQEREAPPYRFRATIPRPTRMAVAKLLDCYEYQACECDDYRSSDAAQFVSDLRGALLASLPGYDEAPWTIGDDGQLALSMEGR